MSDVNYPYAAGNLLEDRNTYFYSRYDGKDFLLAWRKSRDRVLSCLPPPRLPQQEWDSRRPPLSGDRIVTSDLLGFLLAKLDCDGATGFLETRHWIDRLLQRFEVTKRIYDFYTAEFRAGSGSSFRELGLYLSFAELMIAAERFSRALPYVNALLKVVDTLAALHSDLDFELKGRLAWIIHQEAALVERLAARLKVFYAA